VRSSVARVTAFGMVTTLIWTPRSTFRSSSRVAASFGPYSES
jgi:hypothetical protein